MSAGRRVQRLSRLIHRAREAPTGFVAHKLIVTAMLPAWNAVYRAHSSGYAPEPLRKFVVRLSPSRDEAVRSLALVSAQLATPVGIDVEDLVRRADLALENRVHILGFGEIDLGAKIDWSRDYISGYQWPDRPALTLDFVRADDSCDVKVPWEISRLQMLVWLGQAYRLTSKQRYVDHLENVLTNWTRANPVGMGVAWSCPMEAAIRGVNMAYACALAWDALGQDARHAVCRSLREHLTYLRRHPELSDVNGNHYIADLMASVGLGALLTSAGESPRWLQHEVEILEAEVARQVGADGVHHEHALGYHRLVTELIVHAGVALDHAGLPLPASLGSSLAAMLEVLRAVVGPRDHEVPLLGDSDSGQVCILDSANPNSVTTTVALGDALLRGPDGDGPSKGNGAAWVLRARGRAAEATVPANSELSRSFEPSGFLVLGQDESRVVARAGPPGMQGRGAHEHADLTSFTAVLAGLPVVVDPGTSTYTSDRNIRRHELSGAAHNLVILDGTEPFPLRGGSVMDVVTPDGRGDIDFLNAQTCHVRMHHNGYLDNEGAPRVHRELRLTSHGGVLECKDEISGREPERVTRTFLLATEWGDPDPCEHGSVRFRHEASGALLEISFDSGGIGVSSETVAALYGRRLSAYGVTFDEEVSVPAVLRCTFRLVKPDRRNGE